VIKQSIAERRARVKREILHYWAQECLTNPRPRVTFIANSDIRQTLSRASTHPALFREPLPAEKAVQAQMRNGPMSRMGKTGRVQTVPRK